MNEKKAERIAAIIEAATKFRLVNGAMQTDELIKFGLDHKIMAGYVVAWENYVAVIAAPDDDDDDKDQETLSW